jgi:hypothetical protein
VTDTTEMYYAEMEAARNAAEEAYFDARPQFDRNSLLSAVFRAGFERAFQALWKPKPLPHHQESVK